MPRPSSATCGGFERGQARRVLFANQTGGFGNRLPAHRNRQASAEQLESDNAEGIDVRSRVDLVRIAQRLFGTHVTDRSHKLTDVGVHRHRVYVGVGCPRHAEVENLGLTVGLDEDVTRFQITVNHAALVGMLHSVANFDQ